MEAEQSVVPAGPDVASADPKLRGVSGWLMFFIVTLVFLNPIATFGMFGLSLAQLAPLFAALPGLLIVAVLDGVVSLALMSYSIYAGVSLWRARPGAVRTATTFLIAGVAYVLISPLFVLLAGLPGGAAVAALPESYLAAGRSLVYYAIWLSYLRTSKRVQATYAVQAPV